MASRFVKETQHAVTGPVEAETPDPGAEPDSGAEEAPEELAGYLMRRSPLMTTARTEPAPRPVPATFRSCGCRSGRPPSATPAPSGAAGTCPPRPRTRPRCSPRIAATAITRYTQPGDLVADPMCGIGTTLVEAVHLGRDGLGVEYEDRWAEVAAANVAHARRQGATGDRRGDPRRRPAAAGPAPARGRPGAPPWSSPPRLTARPSTGRSWPSSGAAPRAGSASTTTATATTRPTSPARAWTSCSPGSPRSCPAARCCCAPAGWRWSPPGPGGSTASWSTCPPPSSRPARRAGLVPVARCVALLAGLRGGKLIARPSFFQLDNLRRARAKGQPWHLIVHEDVLIFRNPPYPGSPAASAQPAHQAHQSDGRPGPGRAGELAA